MSSKPVGYQTLKCLLKYLDPNLRIQLSMTCPSLQTIEKSIPMYIKQMRFSYFCVNINRFQYQLAVVERRFMYYVPSVAFSNDKFIQLKFGRKNELMHYDGNFSLAKQNLLRKLFKGRNVKIWQLTCENGGWDSDVKFHVKILELFDSCLMKWYAPLIDDSCLPLSLVKLPEEGILRAHHPIIQNAQMWQVHNPMRSLLSIFLLSRLKHQRVHFANFKSRGSCLLDFVENFMNAERETGTHFTFATTQEMTHEVFGGVRTRFRRIVEAAQTDQITLKMNDTAQLVISKVQKGDAWMLGFKVEDRGLFLITDMISQL